MVKEETMGIMVALITITIILGWYILILLTFWKVLSMLWAQQDYVGFVVVLLVLIGYFIKNTNIEYEGSISIRG